ncbi:MAG: glycosyltransferase [Bacteroidota bacterium]
MWIFSLIFVIYAALMLWVLIGIKRSTTAEKNTNSPNTTFSVLIPFRNEIRHLPNLLESIQQLKYPNQNVEFIFINDHSEDDSVEIIQEFSSKFTIRILHNSTNETGKKWALLNGIKAATNDYILTTDADCWLPIDWLKCFHNEIQFSNSKMIVGPVAIRRGNSFLEKFQYYDFLALQAITLGGFGWKKALLCNGANLCYSKNAFFEVDGFRGSLNVASGDDVFLMKKFQQKQFKITHISNSEALVLTEPAGNFSSLVQQRKRWLSKNHKSGNLLNFSIVAVVFMMNLALLALVVLSLISIDFFSIFVGVILLKFLVDFILVFETARQYRIPVCWKEFVNTFALYPFALVLIFIWSFSNSYNWKNRIITRK